MAQYGSVLIVEDNPQLAESIRSFFAKKEDIAVVGVACHSLEAIDLLKAVSPDLIIMDLVMPQSDGFVLLEHLSTAQTESKPEVIVLSALSNESIIKRACELGAIYYMIKPFSMDVLYQRVHDVLTLHDSKSAQGAVAVSKQYFNDRVTSVFLEIGIPSHIKGFQYLCEAVRIVSAEPQMISSITKKLYPRIGETFQTSPMNVERSIRHAIDQAWESGKLEQINKLFGFQVYARNYKPSNGEFISLIANKLIKAGL